MRYFLARQQDTLPNVVFDLIANNEDELQLYEASIAPLIVSEDQLIDPEHPNYIDYAFGQASVEIKNGVLVPADKTVAEQEYNKAVEVAKTNKAFDAMRNSYFHYDGHQFPMTDGAVMFYNALFSKGINGSINVISFSGNYSLDQANLDTFKDAYNAKVLSVYAFQGSD